VCNSLMEYANMLAVKTLPDKAAVVPSNLRKESNNYATGDNNSDLVEFPGNVTEQLPEIR
jgi:hypothetical protein